MTRRRIPRLVHRRWRGVVLMLAFASSAAALLGKVLYLQLVDHDFLTEQADIRHLKTVEISAHRGTITDRNGEPLAVSTPVDSVCADPVQLKPALDRLPELARALGVDPQWLARRVTSNLDRRFIYLSRHLLPPEAADVMSLDIPGICTRREYRRYQPHGEVAGHVIGFTDIDDRGQEGLEAAYDYWLSGEPGQKRVLKDRSGRVLEDVEQIKASRPGRALRTSLDLRLQYLAYRELKRAVAETGAKSGSAVILDPQTGEVLAMANQPGYNPNNRSQFQPQLYRNRAMTDIFEPGSSLKPLILAAALESGRFAPDSTIDTSPGTLIVDGRALTHDNSNLGVIDLTTVLAKSSSVGAGLIALALDADQLHGVLSGLGIGRLTDSGFPGESAGVLRDARNWKAVGQATLSYGYGVSVTAVQLARAYAAIAAGGLLPPVSLLALDAPPERERVLAPETAHALLRMMQAVVSPAGTGMRAAVANYTVAGKTGTAWISDSVVGGYSGDRYTAVFGGIAPATDPRLVAVVVINDPQGAEFYGGDIAAPVFANIVRGALRLLAVPPDALPEPPAQLLSQAWSGR
jgi:cell division protein FtsI (penicillin-binding protein 3)